MDAWIDRSTDQPRDRSHPRVPPRLVEVNVGIHRARRLHVVFQQGPVQGGGAVGANGALVRREGRVKRRDVGARQQAGGQ